MHQEENRIRLIGTCEQAFNEMEMLLSDVILIKPLV